MKKSIVTLRKILQNNWPEMLKTYQSQEIQRQTEELLQVKGDQRDKRKIICGPD